MPLETPSPQDARTEEAPRALRNLRFDDRFTRSLPADPEEGPRIRQVLGACYSRVRPTPVRAPHLIACSREVAALFGLTAQACESREFAEVFAGNRLLPGMDPYAACYGGHQFGNWAGQLGDGRAITLGEAIGLDGRHWELQLKGAGTTPYSRHADGRAVLRSSLREFLCSEAMYHLGVPTTRALSLVATGEQVLRDILYDGHPRLEPGAVVCRVAPSFLRFGNYEILFAREEHALLRQLCDYTITTHFPELGAPGPDTYVAWLEEVCRRTAHMIVHWMRVGFVHGVMNTDNMSILGLTLDYGPYGFLEPYDPSWTPNTTDASGRRYRYENQPQVALWNLVRFANALFPLVGKAEPLERALNAYERALDSGVRDMLAQKLGFSVFHGETHLSGDVHVPPDAELVNELFSALRMVETDVTIFYRRLALVDAERSEHEQSDEELLAPILDAYYVPAAQSAEAREAMATWLRKYVARVRVDGSTNELRRLRMNAANPKYVLRNYLAQEAIDLAEGGDYGRVHQLLEVLRHPYDEQPENVQFAAKRPDWARNRPGCSMLSCSS